MEPLEFANRASLGVSSSQARTILKNMGYNIPSKISTDEISDILKNAPTLGQDDIMRFVKMAGGM